MDAIVGVWLTSLLGATAFSAAGYVLGQRGVVLPLFGLSSAQRAGEHTTPAPAAPLPRAELAGDATERSQAPQSVSAPTSPAKTPLAPPVSTAEAPREGLANADDDDDDDRPTVVPDTSTHAAVVAATVATIPPPRPASLRIDAFELETTKADLQAALAKAESSAQRARAAEAVKAELERQIEALRAELRNELVARATASARADELGDRLASASEEASSLRHKVAILDKQSRQLREALQGRVRALTTSEWHRRRDLRRGRGDARQATRRLREARTLVDAAVRLREHAAERVATEHAGATTIDAPRRRRRRRSARGERTPHERESRPARARARKHAAEARGARLRPGPRHRRVPRESSTAPAASRG